MLRLLTVFIVATLSLGNVVLGGTGAANPCALGVLVYSKSEKCECQRHNGVMGNFRSGCTATWIEDTCLGACNAPEPKEQLSLGTECPYGTRACPVSASEYECVSPSFDLDNCGGCASTGEGVACGDYPGVRGAACVDGVCNVYSCNRGYTLRKGKCVRLRTRLEPSLRS
ncbi:hypothetical protein C8F04DRAFT_185895 [Mycena alexandri]|uniref:Protein CPL1-like domain-containing protein n=1 Tax=Mycena alexandri TaxID=1745969 RepID=A0AAD6T6X1_9AGAR|nr:hypothetical protein C8F04DRAFT_185895 [Mycena alexandri]